MSAKSEVSSLNPSIREHIVSADLHRLRENFMLSPQLIWNSYSPSVVRCSKHFFAFSESSGIHSIDNAGRGEDRPAKTSDSNPSTSIFTKRGMPCFKISTSSVVMRHVSVLSHLLAEKRPEFEVRLMNVSEKEEST